MADLNHSELLASWKAEENEPFQGWDFSHLSGRMIEDQAPWSYTELATGLMKESGSVLDMGTAGGERYLAMREHWPSKVAATEEWLPNLELARLNLSPFGVNVEHVRLTDHDPMPYANGEFDLIINRHSAFNCNEIGRILAPGGHFITQQIHGLWAESLINAFGHKPQWPDSAPEKYVPLLNSAEMKIEDVQEWEGHLSFTDVGALVYYLKAVPWLVPDFSVARFESVLHKFHHTIQEGHTLSFETRKYLIHASRV